MNYKNTEYPHSFVISKNSINLDTLKNFQEIELFEYKIYYSKSYDVTLLNNGDVKHILIGYALDIRDSEKTNIDILEMLHQSDTVIEDLEFIAGRYVYIKAVNKEMYVYSDASQLLPLVFNKEAEIFSSHDNLLAEILRDNNYKITRRPLEVHNELDFTRYEEIQKFNPSMRLRTKDFTYRRIYPRVQLKSASVETVYRSMKTYLNEMVKWLKNNKQPKFVTVTGGIDSRVSASLTRTIDDVEYLTYFMPDAYIKSKLAKSIYAVDRKITTEMKDNLRWNHSIIDLTDIPLSKEELNFYESYYNSKHGYRLDKYYRENKKYYKTLHIKSTVFGMGKADFPAALNAKSSNIDYYKRSVHGINKEFEEHYNLDEEIEKYFMRNLVEPAVTKGRHYFDLYHLESRMGNWHSNLTLETDPETEEFIFTNSRKIIDLIQLPTIDERREFSLYKEIIKDNWPVLLFFGINEDRNLYDQTNHLTETKYKNIIIHSNRKIEVTKTKSSVSLLPKENQILLNDNYNFIIEKKDKSPQNIELKSNYFKEEARGLIKVIVRVNNIINTYDILDLNQGQIFELNNHYMSVSILYNKEYLSPSWRKAGKLDVFVK